MKEHLPLNNLIALKQQIVLHEKEELRKNRADILHMNVHQLRYKLALCDKPIYGSKADLLARMLEHYENPEQHDDEKEDGEI